MSRDSVEISIVSLNCLNCLPELPGRTSLLRRGYGKMLKVSRTIADLEGAENTQSQHVSEAINCRTPERSLE